MDFVLKARINRSTRYCCAVAVLALSVMMGISIKAYAQGQNKDTGKEKAVTGGEKPYQLKVRPHKEGVDVFWGMDKKLLKLGRLKLHIYPDGWQPQLAMQEKLVGANVTREAVVAKYAMGGRYGDGSTLTVTSEATKKGVDIKLKAEVPEEVKEAALAFGSNPRQMLFKVELPVALPTILAGVNQTIMLALSMVVIASLIGAGGLGQPVLVGIQQLNIGLGFEGGIAIVILAIFLDRITQSLGSSTQNSTA